MKTIRVHTENEKAIKSIFQKLKIPQKNSHKGQNGKVMIIGGSRLFHAAPIWSAQAACAFVDMVHFASTFENNEIVKRIKQEFQSGMVVPQGEIEEYVMEDDAILIGSGMMRTEKSFQPGENYNLKNIEELKEIEHEGVQTFYLTKYMLKKYPKKKFVLDAGAVQMMDRKWLKNLKQKAIVTPHLKEYKSLFNADISAYDVEKKALIVAKTAKQFNCIVLLKSVHDIVSDGDVTYIIEGGNAGLTKGGSGDVLAGICVGLVAVNKPLLAAVCASILVKKSADTLYKHYGYWYTIQDIIRALGKTFAQFRLYS